jgi:hypothetical protein
MMKRILGAAFMLAATATLASAQEWELGAIGGIAYSPNVTVRNATASASAGFKTGGVIGLYAGEDMYRYLGAEATYLFRTGDMKLEGNGKSAALSQHTHIITGDFLAHLKAKGARIRPYLSFGGGVEVIQGTGQESATQPLGNLAALTATREVLPVGEVGVGVKIQLSKSLRLRLQVRDYIGQAPSNVIAPAPGASIGGVRQDILGMGAIAFTW